MKTFSTEREYKKNEKKTGSVPPIKKIYHTKPSSESFESYSNVNGINTSMNFFKIKNIMKRGLSEKKKEKTLRVEKKLKKKPLKGPPPSFLMTFRERLTKKKPKIGRTNEIITL